MENYEKVEKLRERADVTYEEAKDALEKNNWDILDAMIYLEKSGKTHGPERASYSTYSEPVYEGKIDEGEPEGDRGFGDMMKRFGAWCVKMLKKACRNHFTVTRHGKEIINVPVIVLIAAALIAIWLVLILLIVGLFFDMRYHFRGPDIKSDHINRAMDNAAQTADEIKKEFRGTENQ